MVSLVESLVENNTFAAHQALMEYKESWFSCYRFSKGNIENNK